MVPRRLEQPLECLDHGHLRDVQTRLGSEYAVHPIGTRPAVDSPVSVLTPPIR